MNEPEIQLTDALRSLAAELDELGREGARPHAPPEIPDFHIKSLLGRGGMGTVYLAEQISLEREARRFRPCKFHRRRRHAPLHGAGIA